MPRDSRPTDKLAQMIRKSRFFAERDAAMGYEDFDFQGWEERARDEGVTEQDEAEWSAMRAKEREQILESF